MALKTFLDFLPQNYRHEKSYLVQNNLLNFDKLSNLSDSDINNIQKKSPLCTLNNLNKIRAIAIFKREIKISPTEAYLLLHCGISSIESLSRLSSFELEKRIKRLERKLGVKTGATINLPVLKDWIKRANENCKSN